MDGPRLAALRVRLSLIWLSLVIVFIECGLFFPFLPGDTLLFALGLFIAGEQIHILGIGNPFVELVLAVVLLTTAAVLGNISATR